MDLGFDREAATDFVESLVDQVVKDDPAIVAAELELRAEQDDVEQADAAVAETSEELETAEEPALEELEALDDQHSLDVSELRGEEEPWSFISGYAHLIDEHNRARELVEERYGLPELRDDQNSAEERLEAEITERYEAQERLLELLAARNAKDRTEQNANALGIFPLNSPDRQDAIEQAHLADDQYKEVLEGGRLTNVTQDDVDGAVAEFVSRHPNMLSDPSALIGLTSSARSIIPGIEHGATVEQIRGLSPE